jgi:hypothetical protein
MREQRQLVAPTTATFATADQEIDFNVPPWAIGATLFLTVSAMAGTAETVDMKLQHILPHSATALDVVGASIVQLAAAASIVITVDPRITAANNAAIAKALSTNMRALIAFGGSTEETYSYALAVEFYS